MAGSRLAIAAVVAAMLASCNPFAGPAEQESMSLEPTSDDGVVSIARAGEELKVTDAFEVQRGDVISTSESGARLQLVGRRSALIGPQSEIRVDGVDSLGDPKGSVIVHIRDGVSIHYDDGVEVHTDSAVFRMSGDPQSTALMAYAGSLTLQAVGEEPISVGPFFEVTLTPGRVGVPSPYTLAGGDPLDDPYVRDARNLESKLDQFRVQLMSLMAGESVEPGLLWQLMPGANASLVRPTGDDVESISDLLIAFGIALNTDGSPERAMTEALDLHRGGAPWGIVAEIVGVEGDELLVDLEALGGRLLHEAAVGASSPDSSRRGPGEDIPRLASPCMSVIDCILDD
jgi:hypothetical protein